jgi:hypothetical protein
VDLGDGDDRAEVSDARLVVNGGTGDDALRATSSTWQGRPHSIDSAAVLWDGGPGSDAVGGRRRRLQATPAARQQSA